MEKQGRLAKAAAWFLFFWVYCVIGWCYEVFLEVVVYRWGFSNRGLLWGPYLPVYGVGAALLLLCLRPLMRRKLRLGQANVTPLIVFLAVVLLTTAVELAASYLLEWTTGGWLWDYTGYAIQWQGRICLSASLRFGIGGIIALYLFQPLLEKAVARLGERRCVLLGGVLFAVFAADWLIQLVRL